MNNDILNMTDTFHSCGDTFIEMIDDIPDMIDTFRNYRNTLPNPE